MTDLLELAEPHPALAEAIRYTRERIAASFSGRRFPAKRRALAQSGEKM